MSYNVMKDLPALPASDGPTESVTASAETLPLAGSVLNLAKPRPHILLERRIAPADMERLRSRWQAVAISSTDTIAVPDARNSNSTNTQTLASVREKRRLGQVGPLGPFPVPPKQLENIAPAPSGPHTAPIPPVSQKRWVMFTRKALSSRRFMKMTSSPETTTSKQGYSKSTKKAKPSKSTPNLKSAAKTAPVKANPVEPTAPKVTLVAKEAATVGLKNFEFDVDIKDGGIYFACDPNWEPSQGDVTLVFVSPDPVDEPQVVFDMPDSPILHGSRSDAEICSTRSLPLRRRSEYREALSPPGLHPIDELHSFLDIDN
ncbi:hypothetical protein BJ138DRAFT_1099972 [Hygrophoropsis aurantiaca]|uniref:Uncharacterized protein n=1 Tax=Hygrophoropsis aurantiaca TaxID=72124 RepID=A0ACB8AHW1_9AGAM|nr:hypothetical protein BJ138DRAFT_1099972 [Hygrophoropsis aurantiaca]